VQWHNKKVLVTGAAGFIGSHLTERLVELGASVKVFVRYNSRGDIGLLRFLPQEILSQAEIVRGDMKDLDAVQKAVKSREIVFHLAALIGIPYSYVHPIDYVQTNVLGTSYLLSACLKGDVSKIVHTSTSEVYGSAKYVPIDEDHPLQGQSPYSASKIAADQMALSFYRSFDLPIAVLRPFNTYGPRQSTRAVIPAIINQVISSDRVWLGSLTPTRDLTFVSDTVDGFIKMAESEDTAGEVVNIGSSEMISIGGLSEMIFDLMGKKVDITEEKERIRPGKSEVERLMANTEKAKKILGWAPRVSLKEGLQKVIDWILKMPSLYQLNDYHV
jgi:NAD dependent epimerase/dehydratase